MALKGHGGPTDTLHDRQTLSKPVGAGDHPDRRGIAGSGHSCEQAWGRGCRLARYRIEPVSGWGLSEGADS